MIQMYIDLGQGLAITAVAIAFVIHLFCHAMDRPKS